MKVAFMCQEVSSNQFLGFLGPVSGYCVLG